VGKRVLDNCKMKMKKNQLKHYILGLERRPSGAFEHSWKFGKSLDSRGFDVDYLAHWWSSPVRHVDFKTRGESVLDFGKISENSGVYHLHTHTWEHEGLLSKIVKNPNSKMLYTLHAIIPYQRFNEKDDFLNGRISYENMMRRVMPDMSGKEMSQLSAIKKTDSLLVISEAHKKILERMKIDKPVHVFENVSDVSCFSEDVLAAGRDCGEKFREELGVENLMFYCGGIYGNKGTLRLLEAFQEIKGIYSSSKLMLLGSGNKERERTFFEGVDKENLKDVILIPWIYKDTPEKQIDFFKYHYASDVLIHPMITENLFSRTVIDAMALGLPTITCKSPYSIGSSRTKEEIVESFIYMKENPVEVDGLVKVAKEKVRRENSWDSYISRVEEVVSQ